MNKLAQIERLVNEAEEDINYLLESLNLDAITRAQFERERDDVVRGVWTKLRNMIVFDRGFYPE